MQLLNPPTVTSRKVPVAACVKKPTRPTGWTVPAAGASLCSIAAVVVLWDDLHPRPEALWVGGVVSAVVLVAVVATLVGGHRAVEPGHTVEGPGVMRGTFDPAAPAEPGAPLGDTPRR